MGQLRTAAVGFGAGVLGAVVAAGVIGAAPRSLVPARLEAKEFVVRDDKGVRRVMLGTRGDDARVAVYDAEGNEKIGLTVEPKGGASSLVLAGEGEKSLSLTIRKDGTGGIGATGVGEQAAVLGYDKTGDALLVIYNKRGMFLAGPVGSENNSVKIIDKDDKPVFKSND